MVKYLLKRGSSAILLIDKSILQLLCPGYEDIIKSDLKDKKTLEKLPRFKITTDGVKLFVTPILEKNDEAKEER